MDPLEKQNRSETRRGLRLVVPVLLAGLLVVASIWVRIVHRKIARLETR